MGTKTITIIGEAYNALAKEKMPNESFSQLIMRTHKKKGDISRFIGAWNNVSDKTVEEMKKDIERLRKNSAKRLEKRTKGI